MKEQGKTIIIITHKLEEVLAISDEVTVMRDGKVVGNVKTSETNAKELARMIVGRDVLLRVEKTDAHPTDEVLEVDGLAFPGNMRRLSNDVSFRVRAGEIVGIAGIEGNGQTELIEALAGLCNRCQRDRSNLRARDITESCRARAEGTRHRTHSRGPA